MPLRITSNDHTLGPADAPHTLVEYADYQCPACGQVNPLMKKLVAQLGDKVRFVFRNYPLEQHEFARAAASTAEFAAADSPEKFWAMHDLLFKEQKHFAVDLFPKLAGKLGLDEGALQKALEAGTFERKLDGDLKTGDAAGVPGTPALFIDGKLYDGEMSLEALVEALGG